MTTLATLIERIRVEERDHPTRDQLNGALNAGAATMNVDTGTGIAVDAFVEIEFEVVRVLTKPSTVQATVSRGELGTTDATHADNTPVYVGFRHPRHQIREAINAALEAIGAAFGRQSWDTTKSFSTTSRLIEVPATASRLLGIYEKPSASTTDLKGIPARFMRSAPSGLIASGKAAHLIGYNPGSGTVYIHYERPWTELTTDASTLDAEYPDDADDLIVTGARAYLADADAFRRLAFDAAHVRLQSRLTEMDSVRLAAREHLSRFLSRRLEVGSREREDNHAWMTGVR